MVETIKIKNTKVFTVNGECKYHWSKLPKLIKLMSEKILDLRGADLSNADLSNTNFSHVNFRGADLSYADLSNADLSNADLSNANLINANLINANLSNANLSNADLSYVSLINTNLNNTDFSYSDLSNADLSYVSLINANLINANLSDVSQLYNCNLSTVKYDYEIYTQQLVGSAGRTITYIPEKDVMFIGCFKGTLKECIKRIDETYSKEHKINKEYKAIIKHFKNLHKIRKG